MSVLLKEYISSNIHDEIKSHPAWMENVTGLNAEKMLRGKKPYKFILRQGEEEGNYYTTFAHPDGSVRHQPFTLNVIPGGWWYENSACAPFTNAASIDDALYLIMHCEREECSPLLDVK